jgi:type II secretory pathway pseudopilin PulG
VNRKGFTVVEVLIALTLSVLVIGGTIAVLTSVMSSAARSEERLQPREQAHLALEKLRRLLADSVFFQVDTAKTRLQYSGPQGKGEIFLQGSPGPLMLLPEGGTPQVLEPGPLRGFTVAPAPPSNLRITLELDRPPGPMRMQPLPPLKITDELYLPCVGSLYPEVPWHNILEKPPGS